MRAGVGVGRWTGRTRPGSWPWLVIAIAGAAACSSTDNVVSDADAAAVDAGAGAIPDAAQAVDAPVTAADAAATAPDATPSAGGVDPASCPLPALDVHYPGPTPQNPWDDWPTAPACAQARHDVIIILGCPSEDDGSPSTCQQNRVDLALRLAGAGYGDRFIPTGAAVANDHVEAFALRDLLIAAGVAADRIFPEPLAEHTDENLYWSTEIMQVNGWDTALVVSEPEHLMYAAVCDANCCVERGRLATFGYPVGDAIDKAASYFLIPPATPVTTAECDHIGSPVKLMCLNLDSRRACADSFEL